MEEENKYYYTPLPEPIPITEQAWPEGTLPLVHTRTMTYMHENFIRECIEGILMQKTTFPVQVLIHDDASTDNTAEIVREYELKYPRLIKAYYQKENSYTKPDKRKRRADFSSWRIGKYEALCEGDDYWTDPMKLQKQVDFLEGNEKYVMCFHKIYADWSGKLTDDESIERRYQAVIDKKMITINDLLKIGNFIHTCSVVFRNQLIKFPFEMEYSPVGDYFLFILLSEKGYLYRLDDYMGIYRRGVGTYSSLEPQEMHRKIVQYHIAILSYLTNDVHKKIFLPKTLVALDNLVSVLKPVKQKKRNVFQLIPSIIRRLFYA
ncbi:MAG: glycosyltransferase [Bacteroidales bacterium]|nr:glycosyltransferase [Bacteroidales bacterium]